MTYQKIKETVVDEQKVLNSKQFKKFIKYALLMLTFMIEFVMIAFAITNSLIAVFTSLLFIAGFIWFLDWAVEENKVLTNLIKLSKLWWLNILLIVGTFVLLKLTNFL